MVSVEQMATILLSNKEWPARLSYAEWVLMYFQSDAEAVWRSDGTAPCRHQPGATAEPTTRSAAYCAGICLTFWRQTDFHCVPLKLQPSMLPTTATCGLNQEGLVVSALIYSYGENIVLKNVPFSKKEITEMKSQTMPLPLSQKGHISNCLSLAYRIE